MKLRAKLKKTAETFRKAGFEPDRIESMIEKIVQILTLYPSPETAAMYVDETISSLKVVKFSDIDFSLFIHVLHHTMAAKKGFKDLHLWLLCVQTYNNLAPQYSYGAKKSRHAPVLKVPVTMHHVLA